MSKNNLYKFFPLYLMMLVPVPGRFVYGFTIILEFLLLITVGILMNYLTIKLNFGQMRSVVILMTLISFTIFFRQIIVMLCPEVALVLGFIFYFPTTSVLLIGIIFGQNNLTLLQSLRKNLIECSLFAIFGFIFFLFRDIAGWGTFTFFGEGHKIREFLILNTNGVGIFTFFASIPGSLILGGIFIFLMILLRERIQIFKNMEAQNDLR
ncbi:MAG: hypothetical protein PUC37_04690 [Spirochaetales bacterium]|nr:hypothetical protein [Spirochaetales bacterium]